MSGYLLQSIAIPAWWLGMVMNHRVYSCFPWSAPDGCVSLRDNEDLEIAFLSTLEQVDDESAAAVRRTLRESGFMLEITKVHALDEEYEI
jgi:hypothetical protein